ncbi:pseudouridine synthase family protein isoform X2 [Wolffia australiana]
MEAVGEEEMELLRRQLELLNSENQLLRAQMARCSQCSKFCAQGSGAIRDNVRSQECVLDQTDESSADLARPRAKDSDARSPNTPAKQEATEKFSGSLSRNIDSHPKRFVALKLMYFGPRFYGFASEAQQDPTVEGEIFTALVKTKLSSINRADLCYSRCGRTDKGVSSTGQVVALYVRSKMKETSADVINKTETCVKMMPDEEIDYVKVLNKALPNDIRVTGWAVIPSHFHARFSCLGREYRYFFWRGSLDIVEMSNAAKKFVGVHDFRNFCKMDAENVKNYVREILSFDISPCCERSGYDELWAMTIKGSAFLWHQVRFMVAVVFMIGQGQESSNVIDSLLDITKVPRKPQYNMAPELPLVLRYCKFKDIHFTSSREARKALYHHLKTLLHNYLLQAAIFREALDCLSDPEDNDNSYRYNVKKKNHIPLLLRHTEPSYEERQAQLALKGKNLKA